ncbi:MAG: hypothetical protein D6731_18225 [Planctomycetota bacterium]|nr:MAG: hypothetical protein D6731_18225 [Planctomycetota bacterium]
MKPTRSDHLSDAELALRGLSRESDLRLDAEGRFWFGPSLCTHPGVTAAFARWIERHPSGRYVLRTDWHYVYLQVDGAPLHARAVEDGPEGPVLRLAGGEREPLRPETLREGPDGTLYASGRDGSWPVRLGPGAALDLGAWLVAGPEGRPCFEAGGRRHPIPRAEDPLRNA